MRVKVGIKEVGECFQGLSVTTEGIGVGLMLREKRWLYTEWLRLGMVPLLTLKSTLCHYILVQLAQFGW